MAPRYEIRLKDQAGAQVAKIVDWKRLQYKRRINDIDSHTLSIDGDLGVVDNFTLDSQVEVWRRDADNGIAWYLEYEGFHRTDVRQIDSRAMSIFTSYGRGYDDLLARRIILYPSGSAQVDKAGVGETVIKEYVNENAGPGATSPPRLLASGVFAGLTIQIDGGAGLNWEGSRAYRKLMEVCQEISSESAVDFGIVGTGPATFQFQAVAYPWGTDRRAPAIPATGLNAAGNVPVVFSLDFGNMELPIYSLARTNEVNAAIMTGQGLEGDRTVIQRTDVAAIAASPWNRMEISRNANLEDTVAGLNTIGDEILEELQARETFTFQAMQIPALLYGRDYFLGDLVTARYRAIERNKQIVGIEIVVTEGRETIKLEVADVS